MTVSRCLLTRWKLYRFVHWCSVSKNEYINIPDPKTSEWKDVESRFLWWDLSFWLIVIHYWEHNNDILPFMVIISWLRSTHERHKLFIRNVFPNISLNYNNSFNVRAISTAKNNAGTSEHLEMPQEIASAMYKSIDTVTHVINYPIEFLNFIWYFPYVSLYRRTWSCI